MLPVKIILKPEQILINFGNGSLNPFQMRRNDFYIYFRNQIIPVVRNRLSGCQLLNEQPKNGKRIFCITEDLDVNSI
jgi:hypothetical protein